MFLFLQFVGSIILLVGIVILFKKILHKSIHLAVGLCIVSIFFSVLSGIILAAIPMPTEEVRIEATGKKNSFSGGNEIALQSLVVDGKEYAPNFLLEGDWIYAKDSSAYMWLDEFDERLKSPISESITLRIPVGAGRSLRFLRNEQSGMVTVSYKGEAKTYDLYGKETGIKSISIADSNAVYDNSVKLLRLAFYGFMILCAVGLAFLLTERLEKVTLMKMIYFIFSVLTALTFFLNMGITTRSGNGIPALITDFNYSLNSQNFLLSVIIIPLLYLLYQKSGAIYWKRYCSTRGTLCIAIPSGMFALFMVIGSAFSNGNTLRPIFENELQLLKSLIAFTGYAFLFFFGIVYLYRWLDQVDLFKTASKKRFKPIQLYLNLLGKHPFSTSFITLLVAYIPYIVVSYPAIFMWDSYYQISMVYGYFELNDAHPVTHTLLLKLCLYLGETLFHSINIGIFIYAMLQFLLIAVVVSFLVQTLSEAGVTPGVSVILLLYFVAHPRIESYMFLVTKDPINGAFMALTIISFYRLFSEGKRQKTYLLIGISVLGMILFRYDSSYILVISLILMFFVMKDFRKQVIVILSSILGFLLCWNIFLPSFNINSGGNPNTGGVLSGIMIQQTARCIHDAGNQLTEEEKEAISTCFNIDIMVSKYTPDDKVDGARSALKTDFSQEDWKRYQSTWLKMFFKYPQIYIEAILNYKYDHLYPYKVGLYSYGYSSTNMGKLKNRFDWMLIEPTHPKRINDLRQGYEALRESFSQVPILNIPFMTSSYWWILFIWLSYCIYRKKKMSVAIMMPLLILVLVLIAGPTNARYFRYLYPYALCLPIAIILGLTIERDYISGCNKKVEEPT